MNASPSQQTRTVDPQPTEVFEIKAAFMSRTFINSCLQTARACLNKEILSLSFSATQAEEERLKLIQDTAESATVSARSAFERDVDNRILELPKEEASRISLLDTDSDMLHSTFQFLYPAHHALAGSLVGALDDKRNLSPEFIERMLTVRDRLLSGAVKMQLSEQAKNAVRVSIVEDFENTFTVLTPALISSWWCEALQPLASAVSRLLASPDQNNLEELTQLIARSREDSRLALPEGKEDWLYLLAFLPAEVRDVLQPLLFFHEIKKQIEKIAQATARPEEKLILEHVLRCAATCVFTDRHFQQLINKVETKEVTQLFLVGEALTQKRELDAIIKQVRSSKGALQFVEGLLEGFDKQREALGDLIEENFESIPDYIYNTDCGHFLFHLYNFNLAEWRLRQESSGNRAQERLAHDGVIIIEDSKTQMAAYRELVSQFSPCSVNSESSRFCSTPNEFLQSYDPNTLRNVSLVIIDIESPEAPYGGIVLAEKILKDLAVHWSAERKESVLVVVWSANPEKVKEASRVLSPALDRLTSESLASNPQGVQFKLDGHLGKPHINLRILHKGDPSIVVA